MKTKKCPAEFLGAKVLSPMEQDTLKGGAMHHQQQVVQQQQQQVVIDPNGPCCPCGHPDGCPTTAARCSNRK